MTLSFKVGTFQKIGTTGNQSITGVGFTPKLLILTTSRNLNLGTFENRTGPHFGAASSTASSDQRAYFNTVIDASSPTQVISAFSTSHIWINASVFGTTQQARVSAFNSDGFTLNWLVNSSDNLRINYIAIGGNDLEDDKVGQFTAPSSTGNFSVTGVGFQPDFVMLLATGLVADDVVDLQRGTWSLGCFNAEGEQAVIAAMTRDDVIGTDSARYQRTNQCLAMFHTSDPTTLLHEATFVSMDSDGFTINFSTADAADKRVIYIAMKGPKTKIGAFESPTSDSTPVSQSITSAMFLPKGLIFLSNGSLGEDIVISHNRYCIGAASSSTSEFAAWAGDKDGISLTGAQVAGRVDSNACIRVSTEAATHTSSTTQALADFTSFNTNGFTISWSVRSASLSYEIIYIAFGNIGQLFSRSIAENVSIDDNLDAERNISRSIPVSLTISAVANKVLTAPRIVTVFLTISAGVSSIKSIPISIAENLTVSDDVTRFLRRIKIVSTESLTLDGVTAITTSIGRAVSESITILDELSAVRKQFLAEVNDSLIVAEASITRFYRANKSIIESLIIDVVVNSAFVIGRQIVNTLSINALVNRTAITSRELAESFEIAATGVGNRLTFLSRSVSESLAISEDGFAEVCKTAGQLKFIIKHQLGRFFSVLPQRNIRAYTFDSDMIKQKEKE